MRVSCVVVIKPARSYEHWECIGIVLGREGIKRAFNFLVHHSNVNFISRTPFVEQREKK